MRGAVKTWHHSGKSQSPAAITIRDGDPSLSYTEDGGLFNNMECAHLVLGLVDVQISMFGDTYSPIYLLIYISNFSC